MAVHPLFGLLNTGVGVTLLKAEIQRVSLLHKPGPCQGILNGHIGSAVKDRRLHPEAQQLGRPAQVGLQDLAQVHPGGHADGIKNNIHWRAVGQEGHILRGGDNGYNPLVTVAAGQLIADGYLPPLGHPYLHPLVDPGRQVIALVA